MNGILLLAIIGLISFIVLASTEDDRIGYPAATIFLFTGMILLAFTLAPVKQKLKLISIKQNGPTLVYKYKNETNWFFRDKLFRYKIRTNNGLLTEITEDDAKEVLTPEGDWHEVDKR